MRADIVFKQGLKPFVVKELAKYSPKPSSGRIILETTSEGLKKILLFSRLAEKVNDFLLYRRGYEVRPPRISADIVSGMIDWSSWNHKRVLLDPFCENSNACIEACMKSLGIPPGSLRSRELGTSTVFKPLKKNLRILCYSSQMSNIRIMQKQAVLAGVNKKLSYSAQLLKNLDIKLGSSSVDNIITCLLDSSFFEEFFFQAEHVLKKDGEIVLCVPENSSIIEWVELYDFRIMESISVGGFELLRIIKQKG